MYLIYYSVLKNLKRVGINGWSSTDSCDPQLIRCLKRIKEREDSMELKKR